MQKITGRCALHYGVTLSLFCLYGLQVCPFLESLTLPQLVMPTLVAFTFMFVMRNWLLPRSRLTARGLGGFGLEVGFFLLGALMISTYNAVVHTFPLESHLKILLGMTTLGFLVAADLTLARDWLSAKQREQQGPFALSHPLAMPVSRKLSLFALATLTLLGAVFFLLFNKDLEWLITVGDTLPHLAAQHYILLEIAFVMAVTFGYLSLIIHGYGRNLSLTLMHQTRTMARVQCGDLNARVPVIRDDEFGLIAASTNQMIGELKARHDELHLTRDVAILGLASLAETRDNETGAHIIRTQHYVKVLAEYLSRHERARYPLDDATIDLLFKSAPLHDVGKVGIPDAILLKPGKLTDEEFAIMKRHPQIGADALASAEAQLGSNSFLHLAREIALTHHEKWDGSGYPSGLVGEAIPLSGRLMAVADVYDALISKRVYKPAFSHEEAKAIIVRGRGSHFDPAIVDAFLACEANFQQIAVRFQDSH
ncbi:HD domain-containing phosphohydrolase [Aeromonas enteropelogenes]|uniref:HD domain-containing phosphohydrolase n=1 Tax=Aeromonas enteropelogenes TaxID=29489 RepID=UPI003B9E3234